MLITKVTSLASVIKNFALEQKILNTIPADDYGDGVVTLVSLCRSKEQCCTTSVKQALLDSILEAPSVFLTFLHTRALL